MPIVERHQVDIFAIVVLVASALIFVFLIVAAIYYMNMMNLKPPNKTESAFLFWISVLLAVLFAGVTIYALIHLFTHKVPVYEETPDKTTVAPFKSVPIKTVPVQTTVVSTAPAPVKISNLPRVSQPSDVSVSFSDLPVTSSQRQILTQELINIQGTMED